MTYGVISRNLPAVSLNRSENFLVFEDYRQYTACKFPAPEAQRSLSSVHRICRAPFMNLSWICKRARTAVQPAFEIGAGKKRDSGKFGLAESDSLFPPLKIFLLYKLFFFRAGSVEPLLVKQWPLQARTSFEQPSFAARFQARVPHDCISRTTCIMTSPIQAFKSIPMPKSMTLEVILLLLLPMKCLTLWKWPQEAMMYLRYGSTSHKERQEHFH